MKHTFNFEHVNIHMAFRGMRLSCLQSSASCVYFTVPWDTEAQQSLEAIRKSHTVMGQNYILQTFKTNLADFHIVCYYLHQKQEGSPEWGKKPPNIFRTCF